MKLLLLASVFVSISQAGDVDEHLAKEAAADARASDDASCWCKKFRQMLEDQKQERQDEIRFLENVKQREHYSNQRYRMEIADHRDELASHQSSLDASESLASRASDKHDAEVTSQESNLRTVQDAIRTLPEGSPSHAALRGIENKLQKHMKEAKAQHDRSHEQMKALRAAKADMLKLERRAAARKTQRYADGLTVVAQAGKQITAYSALLNTDAALKASVDDLCDLLSNGASERHRLRQQAMITSAKANAMHAEHAANRAASKMILGVAETGTQIAQAEHHAWTTARMGVQARGHGKDGERQGVPCSQEELEQAEHDEQRALASLEAAKVAAAALNQLLSSSGDVQARLKALFHQIAVDEYLVSSRSGVGDGVKASIVKIANEAKDMDKTMPALFDKVQNAGRASMLKHASLVTSLRSIKADLSMKKINCRR